MSAAAPDVVAINVGRGLALLSNHEVVPLLVDDSVGQLPALVAGPDSAGFWYAIDGSRFVRGAVH